MQYTFEGMKLEQSSLSIKMSHYFLLCPLVDHFTVVCVVAWPLNESETGVELSFIETSLHLSQ